MAAPRPRRRPTQGAQGFTLLEVVIGVALASVVLGGAMIFFAQGSRSFGLIAWAAAKAASCASRSSARSARCPSSCFAVAASQTFISAR